MEISLLLRKQMYTILRSCLSN